MEDLIKALTILLKYGNPFCPTHCEHDVMTICIDPALVSSDDLRELDRLGIFANNDDDTFMSYRYGSA